MPWCEACSKDWTPNSMNDDGSCPQCGQVMVDEDGRPHDHDAFEDEKDIVDVLEFNLRAEGFEVSSSTNGRDGLTLVHNTRPDLVIVDLMLPDISGNEICRSVRSSAHGKDLPILILSASKPRAR